MKVLFVHEGYLFRKNGNVCSYAYSKKTVQRYKAIAEEVVFLSREDNSLGNDGDVYKRQVSEDVFGRGVCLPSDTKMTEKDMARVCGIIKGLF